MNNIIYRGYNITVQGNSLKAENPYFKIVGVWSEIKNTINKIAC